MFVDVLRAAAEDLPVFFNAQRTLDEGAAHGYGVRKFFQRLLCHGVRAPSVLPAGLQFGVHRTECLRGLKHAGKIPRNAFQHPFVRDIARVCAAANGDLVLFGELKPRAHFDAAFASAACGENVGVPSSPMVTVPFWGVPRILRPKLMFSRFWASPDPSSVMDSTPSP